MKARHRGIYLGMRRRFSRRACLLRIKGAATSKTGALDIGKRRITTGASAIKLKYQTCVGALRRSGALPRLAHAALPCAALLPLARGVRAGVERRAGICCAFCCLPWPCRASSRRTTLLRAAARVFFIAWILRVCAA